MKVQEILFNQILDTLEKVDPTEWENYLKEGIATSLLPYNPISKTLYKRTNKFSLLLFNLFGIFKSNHYATFKQITQAGGKIRKGAKAVDVIFYNPCYRHNESGKFINEKKYNSLPEAEKEHYKKTFTGRIFKVFNFDFVENISDMNFDFIPLEDEVNKVEEIESFIQGTDAKITHGNFTYGCYIPLRDLIKMPRTIFFKDEAKYYATLLHELVHWSGHETRLNREGVATLKRDEKTYSFEELIAELGSVILYTDFNLISELENSCKYIKGWMSNLEGKREVLHEAFNDANKAVNYLKKMSLKGEILKSA